MIGLLRGQVFNQALALCDALDRTFFHSYSGIASPFLKPIMATLGPFSKMAENMRNDP